jgi:hypothetical protein
MAILLAATGCMTGPRPTLEAFEATLLASDSATQALTRWCALHDIADTARIRAITVQGGDTPAAADLRDLLAVSTAEPLGYRHVRLVCGKTVLSEAHNWYVPSLLAPEMNRTLDESDTPFGTVAASLDFSRTRLASHHGPLPECPADTVLSQRALLRLPDGRPLALLLECYTAANLGR